MQRSEIVFKGEKEVPPLAVSLGTMLVNKTGSWRYLKPIYDEKIPPCNDACPIGNDIQGFLDLISKGKLIEAWKLIKKANPLPGVCGRVCPHPCETKCNRGEFDEGLSIQALERLAADYALKKGIAEEMRKEGKQEQAFKVAIIGSGPAGLACASELAKVGMEVKVFEALPSLGGMLRVGIPKYRLPREVLNKEIAEIKALGVLFKTNSKIVDIGELKGYDAVFIATGAHKSRRLDIPGENAEGVISGLEFLRDLNLNSPKGDLGKVIVIGGGNTAIDAARSVLRLGAKPTIVYRRRREEMPAIDEEVEAACEEGIEIIYLASPKRIITQEGKVRRVEFIKMRLGEPDESGRRRPIPIEGSEFIIDAKVVITAIGELPDISFLPKNIKLLESGFILDGLKIFAGGDVATGAGTVVDAIASGKRAASAIQSHLRGEKEKGKEKEEERGGKEIAHFEGLNLAYFSKEKAQRMAKLPLKGRISTFREVNLGLSEKEGEREARRCFSCGVCNSCDNCLIFCPDVAVTKLDDKYEINYDYCKGCGICSLECPRSVISLIEEGR